jgi:asparagine synthetase B (glutamine-hydrolysing)
MAWPPRALATGLWLIYCAPMAPPPLANLFAARIPDPVERRVLERRLAETEELAPGPSVGEWVVGMAPLPGGAADPPQSLAAGLLFAEGRDHLVDSRRDGLEPSIRRIVDVVVRTPQRLAEFPGDFGFIHLQDGAATVVRSCGGLVPFYFHRLPDRGVAIATRLDLLVRLLDLEHAVDPLVAAIGVSGWSLNPDARTLLRDVSVIPRGCFAQFGPGGSPRIGRYWDPRPGPVARLVPSDEHAPRLRSSLLATLDRDLDPGGGNVVGLSGGVDSSAIAALAAGVLERPCSALSFITPDRQAQALDLRYIDSLCQRVGLDPAWRIVLEPERWLQLIGTPVGHALQMPHPILSAVAELSRTQEINVLVGGEAADEMCGSAQTYTDWLDHTSLWALIRGGRGQLPFGPRDPLRWLKRRVQRVAQRVELPYPIRLRRFVRPEVQEEYGEWRARRRALARVDRRPLLGLTLWCEHDGWVAMNWEVTSALGIRRSLPFYTREIQELAFECHPRELIGPSTKKLLRAALHDDVPHLNLFRPDKGNGGWGASGMWPFPRELPEEIRTIVDDEWFERPPSVAETIDVLGLAHLSAFQRRLSAVSSGAPAHSLA